MEVMAKGVGGHYNKTVARIKPLIEQWTECEMFKLHSCSQVKSGQQVNQVDAD